MRSDYKVYRYDRLDAPVVTAGSAAVLIGAQNGLFPDMGYAVPGEMGGLWAGEKKICDGFFLAVDDVPLTQADACEIQIAYAIGVAKGNTALLDTINGALEELTNDGTIQSIVDKYISAN